MSINIEEYQLKNIIIDAIEIGIMKGQMMKGNDTPYISQREGFRLYGKAAYMRWVSEGLVKEIKDGEDNCKIRVDRLQIATIACGSNRGNYKESLRQSKKRKS
jgi:hypothetical protein